MRKMNKIAAVILAAAMTMSMGTASFAAELANPRPIAGAEVANKLAKASDTGVIKVNNVSSGTIYAYKVAEGIYEDGYFKGYKSLAKDDKGNLIAIADLESKAYELTAQIVGGNPNNYVGSTELDKLSIGTYIIVVEGTGDARVYNPMMGSIYYNPDDNGETILGTEIDAKYTNGGTVDKVISEVDGVEVGGKETTQITKGSVVEFTVTGNVPSYDLAIYENIEYTLTDRPSAGLEIQEDTISVTVPGVESPVQASLLADGSLEFKLTDQTPGLTNYLGKQITITYQAKVTADPEEGPNKFDNEVGLTYSNKPGSTSEADKKHTDMYTYDFNDVLTKVDENDHALDDAEFTLYTDEDCAPEHIFTYADGTKAVYTTGKDGDINFFNLPARTFWLKETRAPRGGYQLAGKVFRIDITVNETDKTKATFTITDVALEKEKSDHATVTTIVNTKLSALPSTGGTGTYVFTIVGVVIMAGAAGLLIAKRRRDA